MVSVIVPIYNSEKYLPQCLKSIINQTYKDLEIILVNDASNDNSLETCYKYQQKDKRIVIIDKKQNEGVEKARYSGLSAAKGEYFTFVDSDDWLETKAIEIMIENAKRYNTDITSVEMQRVMGKSQFIKKRTKTSITGLIQQPELMEKYFISFLGANILSVTAYGKLYKTATTKSYIPTPIGLSMGEDLYLNMMLFPNVNSIYICEEIGYNYRWGGMTTRYNTHLYPDLKKLYFIKKELIEKYQYHKADNHIRFEIKNILLSDIKQRIIFKHPKEQIIIDIEKELHDPLWEDLKQVHHDNFINSPFTQAIFKKSAADLYDIAYELAKKERLLRILKTSANYILRYV